MRRITGRNKINLKFDDGVSTYTSINPLTFMHSYNLYLIIRLEGGVAVKLTITV